MKFDWRADLIGAMRLCGLFGRSDRQWLRHCLDVRVELKTEEIEFKTGRPFPGTRKFYDVGRRLDGNWDTGAGVSVLEHARTMGLYPEIYDFFDRNIEYEQIPAFRNAITGTGRKWRSSRDPEFLKNYSQKLRDMYDMMAVNGYECRKQPIWRSLRIKDRLCEVLVDVGRDGQPLFVDGLHRYLIAHKLNIPVVCQPVVIHKQLDTTVQTPLVKRLYEQL